MSTKLYLDDIREAWMTYSDWEDWMVFRSPIEFLNYFKQHHQEITHVSFDHDLNCFLDGGEVTGYTCLKDICNFMMDEGIDPFRYLFMFHSANPVGRENMVSYWDNFRKSL